MSSDNEIQNIAHMIQYIEENEVRMAEQQDEINELRKFLSAQDHRISDLMRQMQMMALIGRDSGPTV